MLLEGSDQTRVACRHPVLLEAFIQPQTERVAVWIDRGPGLLECGEGFWGQAAGRPELEVRREVLPVRVGLDGPERYRDVVL